MMVKTDSLTLEQVKAQNNTSMERDSPDSASGIVVVSEPASELVALPERGLNRVTNITYAPEKKYDAQRSQNIMLHVR